MFPGLARLVRWRAKKKKPVAVFVSRLTSRSSSGTIPARKRSARRPRSRSFRRASDGLWATSSVQSFTIPHDAVDPVGFCFYAEGVKIGIATDLGYMPDSIKIHLRRVQILLLESNHDLEMLKVGPYPWSVKQRVMGRNGHLSNAAHLRLRRERPGQRRADPDTGAPERAQQPSRDCAHGRGRVAGAARHFTAPCHCRTEETDRGFCLLIPRYTRPEMGAVWSDQK